MSETQIPLPEETSLPADDALCAYELGKIISLFVDTDHEPSGETSRKSYNIGVPVNQDNILRIGLTNSELEHSDGAICELNSRLDIETDEDGNTGVLIVLAADKDKPGEPPLTLYGEPVTSLFAYRTKDGAFFVGAIHNDTIVIFDNHETANRIGDTSEHKTNRPRMIVKGITQLLKVADEKIKTGLAKN